MRIKMRMWTELLPVFVFKWLARRTCSRFDIHGWVYVDPGRDILVRVHDEDEQ
jgi:hypothetical protein